MTDAEKVRKAFAPLRASDTVVQEVLETAEQENTHTIRKSTRTLLIAAVIAVLLVGTALAAVVISNDRNPIVVNDMEEMQTIAAEAAEQDTDVETGYSYAEPGPQPPLSQILKDATGVYDIWKEEGRTPPDGPLWERHGAEVDDGPEHEYVAEMAEDLNEADPERVSVTASLEDTGFVSIPYSSYLEVTNDEDGDLRFVYARLCWLSEDERYFQMEYDYYAEAVDWGLSFVSRDAFDEVAEYTTADGREFVITTYQDRLWAESTAPNEVYSFYGVGIGIREAETLLDRIAVTVQG